MVRAAGRARNAEPSGRARRAARMTGSGVTMKESVRGQWMSATMMVD